MMDKKGLFEVIPINEILIDQGFNVYSPLQGELFDSLQDSLNETGQLHPIIVNRTEDGYHLVAGEQRLLALTEGKAETVECKVFCEMTELEKAEVSIIENEQRRSPSPMEQARGMKRLRELGRKTGQIAELYGVSDDTVIRREKLLELEPEVQKMIERPHNPLPIHQALMLGGKSKSDQIQLARKIAPKVGPIMGEKEAKDYIDLQTGGPKLPDPGPKSSRGKKTTAAPQSPEPEQDDKSQVDVWQQNQLEGKKLKPVAGGLTITDATFKIDKYGNLLVSGVMNINFAAGKSPAKTHTVNLSNFMLGLQAEEISAVIKRMKKVQPKRRKKTAE